MVMKIIITKTNSEKIFLGIQIMKINPNMATGTTAIMARDQLLSKSPKLQRIFFANTNTFVNILRMLARTKHTATPKMSN